MSVFASDIEFDLTAKFLHHLIFCDPNLAAQLAVHLFYDASRPPRHLEAKDNVFTKWQLNCSENTIKVLERLFEFPAMKAKSFQKWRTAYPYPQNLARNIARKGANSAYTFVTDVDIIPNENSAKNLQKFLKEKTHLDDKSAFVIAVYELDSRSEFPKEKSDLIQRVQQRKARPFHDTVFKLNQHATNFSM